jgi:hypothetical protein
MTHAPQKAIVTGQCCVLGIAFKKQHIQGHTCSSGNEARALASALSIAETNSSQERHVPAMLQPTCTQDVLRVYLYGVIDIPFGSAILLIHQVRGYTGVVSSPRATQV